MSTSQQLITRLSAIPDSAVAVLARIGLGAMFWLSGQTKIEGFVANPLTGEWLLGWPHLSASAHYLFAEEYRLPLLAPDVAALLAAIAEHLLPLLLLLGLATRFAAAGLLAMTLVIQFLVYPDAWPTHAIWAALLLFLIARGGGVLSLDHVLFRNRH